MVRKKTHCFTLFCAICLFFCTSSIAAENDRNDRVVKVAYYFDTDYFNKNEKGHYRGYDVEYLYEISKYTGWQYKFVDCGGWENAVAALEAGKVDILPGVYYSLERARKFLFSARKMSETYVTLMVRNESSQHSYNDIAKFQGMRVGVLRGSLDAANFAKWCVKNNLTVRTVEYPSVDSLFLALDAKIIDGVAETFAGKSADYRIVAEFDPLPNYFALAYGRTNLKQAMDQAMARITVVNPNFEADLYDKYLSVNVNQKPVFTKDEQEFIHSARPVPVAVYSDDAPYSYLRNGRLHGILPDLFQKFSDITDLRFRYVPVPTRDSALALVAMKKAVLIAQVDDDVFFAAENGLILTNPYMRMTVAQITLAGTDKVRTVAVPEQGVPVTLEKDQDGAGYMDVRRYHSAQEGFRALSRGDVDALYCNSIAADYLMGQSRAANYSVTSLASYSYRVAIGIRADYDPRLLSILNTSVRYTSSSLIDELVLKNSQVEDASFFTVVQRIPVAYIVAIIFILFVISSALAVSIIFTRKHIRAEARLVEGKKRAQEKETKLVAIEKANEEKAEFFANISHDMRTPLNGILGFSDLARQTEDSAQIRNYLDKIQISGKLLLNLVNDTLDLSKIASGKYMLVPEIIDSEKLIESVYVPIKSAADAKGVKFVVDTSKSHLGYVRVDPVNLEKIFLNLLSNAVKFTSRGGTVEFRIACLDVPVDGSNCRITVRDTGIGIGEKFMPKLFDPFTQEHSPEATDVTGTGLGLSVVKRLVVMMGGSIRVESLKGKGTCFIVYLPIEQVQDDIERKEKSQSGTVDFFGRKILLCEDNALNMEISKTLLESRGFDVICAENGSIGVEKFSKAPAGSFCAILMDLRMPVMNGYEAALTIRSLDRSDAKNVPIIAMSADAYAEDIRKCVDAGMNAHIAKPVDAAQMFRTLENFCKG